jgi:NitT/TauT family transport system substrate-binding protein
VIGVTSISSFPLYLNSRNPEVKSIDDFTDKDRIGMPSIKTSLAAGILQMAVAKNNGVENYAKLDPITVGIPQPDGMAALLSGKSGITAHFTSPPFSYIELEDPHIHRVLSSVDVMGHTSLALAFSTRRFVDANPILCKAFLGAVEEADAFIQAHPDETADIFARTSDVKVTPELARKIMANPDTVYTSVPSGMQTYLDFMYSIGILKTKAQSWKELFAGDILNKNGS